MTVLKSQTEIVQDLLTSMTGSHPEVDTSVGDVVRDLSVDHVAKQTNLLYNDLSHYRLLTSLKNASSLTIEEMDNLAENFNIDRLIETYATGAITFIGSTSFTVPKNSRVSTSILSDGTSISFTTALQTSSPVVYPYTASIPIVAEEPGTIGNVIANVITFWPSSINGISSITNPLSTSGGVIEEANEALAARCLAVANQSDVGTKPGYRRIMLDQLGVDAVEVVGPSDVEMERNAYGSSVDVYYRGSSTLDGFSQVTMYDGSGSIALNKVDSDDYYHLPAKSITSVVGLHGGTNFSTSQYTFNQDVSSIYAYSQRATDKIAFSTSMVPLLNEYVTINGTYNSQIKTLQEVLDQPENRLIATDVLVKEATEVPVTMSFSIGLYSGYNSVTASNDIKEALVTYITALGLGGDIEEADLVQTIYKATSAVSYVLEPFTELRRFTDPAGTTGNIIIYRNEYSSITESDITIGTM